MPHPSLKLSWGPTSRKTIPVYCRKSLHEVQRDGLSPSQGPRPSKILDSFKTWVSDWYPRDRKSPTVFDGQSTLRNVRPQVRPSPRTSGLHGGPRDDQHPETVGGVVGLYRIFTETILPGSSSSLCLHPGPATRHRRRSERPPETVDADVMIHSEGHAPTPPLGPSYLRTLPEVSTRPRVLGHMFYV